MSDQLFSKKIILSNAFLNKEKHAFELAYHQQRSARGVSTLTSVKHRGLSKQQQTIREKLWERDPNCDDQFFTEGTPKTLI